MRLFLVAWLVLFTGAGGADAQSSLLGVGADGAGGGADRSGLRWTMAPRPDDPPPRRWRIEQADQFARVSASFEEGHDTPDFINTLQGRVAKPGFDDEARSGVCAGMVLASHIMFRGWHTMRKAMPLLFLPEDPLHRLVVLMRRLPPYLLQLMLTVGVPKKPEEYRLRHLARSSPATRERLARFVVAAQLHQKEWASRRFPDSAKELVSGINRGVKEDGTVPLAFNLYDDKGNRVGSHVVLAHAILDGTITTGSGASAEHRKALVILFWDPNLATATPASRPIDPAMLPGSTPQAETKFALLYDGTSGQATFTDEYLRRYESTGKLQLREYLDVGEDIWFNVVDVHAVAETLRRSRAKQIETNVHGFPAL
jgi:hypothetical protein